VFLRWAQAVLIPVTFAVLFGYALTLLVDMLEKHARLPEAVGAALT
jgi:predicted PurR-regulated permease PerM